MSSYTNLELKHFCSHFTQIRKILKKIGAKKERVKKQIDYFFFLPKQQEEKYGRLKLRKESMQQKLVYYERPPFQTKKETASSITCYVVKDPQLLPFLEASLGVKARVEKRREVWRKDSTVFHLDTVKDVGNIFEIEVQKEGKISTKDKYLFAEYQKLLQPFLGKVIKGSNVDLVSK